MCGIWCLFGTAPSSVKPEECVKKLLPRGPEFMTVVDIDSCIFGFTRLAINGLTANGNQPMKSPCGEWRVVCNGEIFNYRELAKRFDIPAEYLGSDCYVIPWLLAKLSVRDVCRLLDGVFAFVAYHIPSETLHIGRDSFGIRPLFVGRLANGAYCFSSELKGLPLEAVKDINVFPPSSYAVMKTGYEPIVKQWTALTWHKQQFLAETTECMDDLQMWIRLYLVASVEKRMLSDRPVGALLSGGLDSSLVAALAAKTLDEVGQKLHTFSIGFGSETPDIVAARKVAAHIGSIHHEIVMDPAEAIAAVEPVIKACETYDITSVRASVGNWLLGKWIKENTDIKVVLNGDGSDELFGGYLYFYRAPSEQAFENEIERLLGEIHLYDVLRSERSMAAHGLESRTPFLDRQLVDFVRRLPTSMFMPSVATKEEEGRPEKWMLRKAFAGSGLLPDEILWRRKEAFSDGVSSKENSWFQMLQAAATNKAASFKGAEFKHNPPLTDEALWYRGVYEKEYGSIAAGLIPHMWMPQWSPETTDPSARTLGIYASDKA
jgi:asparagine synthase (glutamine-hydrolysing)